MQVGLDQRQIAGTNENPAWCVQLLYSHSYLPAQLSEPPTQVVVMAVGVL